MRRCRFPGRRPDLKELGVVCISGSILIARPPEVVFDVLADERNEPAYNPRMLQAEKLTAGPIGPGTRFATTVRTGGRTTPVTVEYTSVDRPRQLASTASMPSARIVGRVLLEPVTGGTRLWWSWALRPQGAVRLLRPLLGIVGNRQERRIWTAFRDHLERTPVTGQTEFPAVPASPAVSAA